MKVGDLVRTKQKHSAYGYERPVCVIISTEKRIDGLVINLIDPGGGIHRWFEEDLEVINV